LALNLS